MGRHRLRRRRQQRVRQAGHAGRLLGLTGIPFVNVRNGCATGGVALATAANAIRAGETDLALVVGFDKHARGAFAASPADYGHADWYAETGLMITTQFFSMKDRRYLHTHGLKDRLLAQVAAKAFRCGELNPDAWRRTALTEEEILAARVINPPLTQYMLCSPSEGAAAVVLARSDRAADLCDRPVQPRRGGQADAAVRFVRGVRAVAAAGGRR